MLLKYIYPFQKKNHRNRFRNAMNNPITHTQKKHCRITTTSPTKVLIKEQCKTINTRLVSVHSLEVDTEDVIPYTVRYLGDVIRNGSVVIPTPTSWCAYYETENAIVLVDHVRQQDRFPWWSSYCARDKTSLSVDNLRPHKNNMVTSLRTSLNRYTRKCDLLLNCKIDFWRPEGCKKGVSP